MNDSRRRFLRWSAAAGAAAFTAPYARAASVARIALGPAISSGTGSLLLLELKGGNDGLSMVVPYGDDAYHRARPTLAKRADELFTLDEYRGLHVALTGCRDAWDAGELAIVEGCGYPDPNRSHFKSMDIWHTADLQGRGAEQGWIGSLADQVWEDDVEVNRIVHIGGEAPYSLNAKTHGCAAFEIPEGYRWLDHDDGLGGYADVTGGMEGEGAPRRVAPPRTPDGDTLDAMRKVLNRARASSAAIREAALGYRTPVEYPSGDLGATLRTAASLLTGGIGSRVVSVTFGGFDTHNNERNRHDALMRDLGAALAALRTDLTRSEAGKRTTLMAFSEFGRRVTENGSGGTDHGTAGPMLVMGPRVKGGLYGKHPGLDDLEQGDMAFTTDFRRVYTDVAMGVFEAPKDVIDKRFRPLGIVRKA